MHFSTTLLAGLGLASSLVSAHMVMTVPKPFNPSALNNSPLLPDGSDYPCKKSAGYGYVIEGERTPMALGSSQPLEFMGSAVHGGGSCQISITYDLEPTANSEFKVIHSWESGCPMDIDGNNGNNASLPNPTTFNFIIPDNLPSGDAVIAWSWMNRLGNREMYMNCGPITITGGPAKRDARLARRNQAAYQKLPDIFKANIGNGCETVNSMDVAFPDPGDFLEFSGSRTPVAPVGNCGSTGNPPAKPQGNKTSPSNAPILIETETKPNTTVPVPAGTPSPGVPTNPKPTVPPPAATVVEPVVGKTSPENVENIPATGGLTGACQNEGEWNCLGGSFQRCSSGRWSVVQPLAAGMECKTGQGMDFTQSRKASP